MNNKTDWPDWANYKTVDADGAVWWHGLKPNIANDFEGQGNIWFSPGRMRAAGTLCNNWRDSLERRPKDNSNE